MQKDKLEPRWIKRPASYWYCRASFLLLKRDMTILRRCCILALFTVLVSLAWPENSSVLGEWTTPNGSVVSIYRCGSAVCARVVAVSSQAPSHVDAQNPNPALRSRPLCGLQIGANFHLTAPNHAEGGRLYDPKSGNTYSGWMTSSGDLLKLRGYIGISLFGRTETWIRARQPVAPCHS